MSAHRVTGPGRPLRWQAALGLVAQASQGAAPVGLPLCVHRSHSLATAGAITAVYAVVAGVARLCQGRATSVIGCRPVLLVCTALHLCGLAVVALTTALAAPTWLTVGGAVAGGLGLPPVGMAMRLTWIPGRLGTDRSRAYGLVTLTQELATLLGPLLLLALLQVGSPALAMVLVTSGSTAAVGLFAGMMGSAPAASTRRTRWRGSSARADLVRLTAARTLLGVAIGSVQFTLVTLPIRAGSPRLGPALIAIMSIGGVLGAVVYRHIRWASPPTVQFVRTAVLMGLSMLAVAAVGVHVTATTLLLAAVPAMIVGLALNPALTTMFLWADDLVPPALAPDAFGLLSAGLAAGTALGTAGAGLLGVGTWTPGLLLGIVGLGGAIGIAALDRVRCTGAARDPI